MNISDFVNIGRRNRWDEAGAGKYLDLMEVTYELGKTKDHLSTAERAYANGVKTGFTGYNHGTAEVNDKEPDQFIDGFMCGLGMNRKDFDKFCTEINNKEKKERERHNLKKLWLDSGWGLDY